MSYFGFVLDGGSENKGGVRRVKQALRGSPSGSFVTCFCLVHICHNAIKEQIVVMDTFVWPEPYTLSCKYFTYVSNSACAANATPLNATLMS